MKERKNIRKLVWILFVCLSVIFWIPKLDLLLTADYEKISEYILLDDSWDIVINGDTYQNISLDDFHFQLVNKGDKITMERVLPKDWGMVEGALRFPIKQTVVSMYIDDELIYEYGQDRAAQNKTVGDGYQFIDFPKEYEGKTLKVCLDATENKTFSSFESIRIYEWKNAYRAFITENRLPMIFGFFLVLFGISILLITAFALLFSRKYIRLFCISLLSLCMGLWTLCNSQIALIFSIPLYSISLIECIALYLGPLSLTAYMYEDVKKLKQKPLRLIYRALVVVQLVAITVMMTLHTLDIVHLTAMTKYLYILIACCMVFFCIIFVLNLKTSHTINRIYLVGMFIVSGCVVYDMVCQSMKRYYGDMLHSLKGVSSIGMMIFIFMLFVSFYIEMTQRIMQEAERNSLIKRAYTDELTQIHNRRYCIEYMNGLKEVQASEYTVICFDLNNLKKVNDTYGHAKGDILIKSAAEVIAETFEGHGIVARMGGDEFIAVLKTAAADTISMLMEQFQKNIHKKNEETGDLNMSIACGYASGSDRQNDIDRLYQIADDRMYENKKQMKGTEEIRR